jgi:WD40 repeat protein
MGVSIDGFATIWNGADQNAKPFRQAPMSLHEGHRYLTQAAVFMKGAIATTSFDGTAVVWDRDTGSMIAQFPEVGITGVLAGSVDGKWLITGYSPSDKTGIQSTAIEENPANLQIWSLAAFRNARPTVPAPDEFRTRIAVGKQDFNEETNVPIPDSPFSIAISPEGRWGLVGTDHGYLNLIDLQTKQSSPAIAAHLGSADSDPPTPEGVTGVAFLSETDSVTAGLNGIIRFWKIQNGLLVEHPTRKPYVHTNGSVVHRVIGLVASTEGSRIATRLLQRTPNPPEFRPIWLHHVTADGVQLIDKLPRPIAGSDERNEKILSISLDSDGTRLLAAVAASKSDEPKKSQSVLREWILTPSSVSESEDVLKSARGFDFEQALYVPGESDRIAFLSNRIVSIRKRTDTKAFDKHPSEDFGPTVALQACDLSIDGTLAVTTSDFLAANDEQPGDARNSIPRLRGEIRIWKIAGSTGTRVYGRQISATATVAMSPVDPRLILVGGAISDPSRQDQPENAAVLYRWSEKELVFVQRLECELGADRIIRGRFSRDGKRIVTATREGHVEVFEHDGAIFKSIHRVDLCTKDSPLRLGSLIAVDLNDQGQLILAADKNSVLVIDAETGKPLVEDLISGHSGDITEVRFAIPEVGQEHSPKRFWTASMDGTTKLWGLTTGKSKTANLPDTEMLDSRLLLTLRGHRQGVVALTALPKGGVVTASKDGQVIKWPIKPRTESKSADQTYEKR